jgi:dihydropteroate synthase
MGILNATPDSFSGDGLPSPAAVADLAARFEAEGADILDIGAESSRPGAEPLAPEIEIGRLLPALDAVRQRTSLPISIDTYHADVAKAALAMGADAINDIHGLQADPAMARTIAMRGAALIAMHNQRGHPHCELVGDIRAGFARSLRLAADAGIPDERIILDPGFGFGWAPGQNLEIIRRLPELQSEGLPILIGPSRKSTIGFILDTPVDDRLEGTAALVALSVARGADIVRVHDVRAMARVTRVADAVARANWRSDPAST